MQVSEVYTTAPTSDHTEVELETYALLDRLGQFLSPEGVIVIGDVSFPTRAGLEACREAYEDGWDDTEFYIVREELEQAMTGFDVDCIPISFCADVLILSPAN